jgi:hypothetical protein
MDSVLAEQTAGRIRAARRFASVTCYAHLRGERAMFVWRKIYLRPVNPQAVPSLISNSINTEIMDDEVRLSRFAINLW